MMLGETYIGHVTSDQKPSSHGSSQLIFTIPVRPNNLQRTTQSFTLKYTFGSCLVGVFCLLFYVPGKHAFSDMNPTKPRTRLFDETFDTR